MYLFNEKGKAIEVYEMTPQEGLLASYRKKEMEENIPADKRLYYARTNYYKHLTDDEGPFTMDEVDYEGKLTPEFFRINHVFGLWVQSDVAQMMRAYYRGDFDDKKAVKITDRSDRYFVLPADSYEKSLFSDDYLLTNIIRVPESLYLLQLLNQGKFAAVVSEDIDEQLGLFEVSQNPVYALDRTTLENSFDTGLSLGTMDEMMEKVQVTEQVLKRVRKCQERR